MSILPAAVLIAVLGAPAAAAAATFASGDAVALSLADALISRRPILVEDPGATQGYFQFDALLTLGALAIAGGALAAWGGRNEKRPAVAEVGTRSARALQAELAHKLAAPRDAA